MGLNKDFIGLKVGPLIHEVSELQVLFYANAIGAAPTTEVAPPCFSAVYELPLIYEILSNPDLHGSKEQREKNMLMMLHGDQNMKFYKSIYPGDEISYSAEIVDIEDKGSGEVIKIHLLSTDIMERKVAESNWGLFIRGVGSGKKPLSDKPKEGSATETKKVLFSKVINIPQDITSRYSKASNDMNPIHLNDEVAKRAGFPGIVAHGMCTMAMTAQGIMQSFINSERVSLSSLGVRFSAPVFPGDELEIKGYEAEEQSSITFDVSRKSDGIKVIKDGSVRLIV